MDDDLPLTLAVVVNDGPLARWVHRALAEVVAVRGVRLALILSHPPRALADEAARSLLGRLYAAVDQWWFPPPHDLRGPMNPGREIPGATGVAAATWDSSSHARLLREHQVEAVLDLSDQAVTGDVTPPLGTWRLAHAGTSADTAALSCLLSGATSVRSVLHSTADPAQVLAESISKADHASMSRTHSALLWKSVALVRRGVRRLQRDRSPATWAALPVLDWPTPSGVSARDLRRRLPTLVTRLVRHRRERRRYDTRWTLLTGRRQGADIIDIERVTPPDGHFWADPMVVADGADRYVFYEDYRNDRARGHIAVAPIDRAGRLGAAQMALERPYHLSYPWVFAHGGQWYMVPETQANRTIEVYRCLAFPSRWQFSHVLMADVRAVDATFLQHEGRWWMFANVAEFEGSATSDELCAFWADDPLSTHWQPHPHNPVVSDVGRARPAGPFVRRDGRLFRPSQDCASEYGGAVCVNEVLALTETAYEERCVGRLEATWDPHVVAMHTVSEHDGQVVLDGKLRSRRGQPAPVATHKGRCPLR